MRGVLRRRLREARKQSRLVDAQEIARRSQPNPRVAPDRGLPGVYAARRPAGGQRPRSSPGMTPGSGLTRRSTCWTPTLNVRVVRPAQRRPAARTARRVPGLRADVRPRGGAEQDRFPLSGRISPSRSAACRSRRTASHDVAGVVTAAPAAPLWTVAGPAVTTAGRRGAPATPRSPRRSPAPTLRAVPGRCLQRHGRRRRTGASRLRCRPANCGPVSTCPPL
jgi:hypothetical protein